LRVALAEDSVLFREGLVRLLEAAGFDVVGQAGDAIDLLEIVERSHPDVAITDIHMPPTHTTEGLDAALRIRAEHQDVGVLVLSQFVETQHAMALLAEPGGRVGYLLKDRVTDLAEFADAVRRVGDGGSVIDPQVVAQLLGRRRVQDPLEELNGRERELLALMAQGLSNQGISERLFLSPKTVETHVHSIFMKLGLQPATEGHRRVLAVLAFLRSPDEPATTAGVRRDSTGDRLVATVLFSDIVGSTQHASALGDKRWRALLTSHDAAVRSALQRFGGREVKQTGDGFLATFESPAVGVRCAVAIRETLARLGLQVRCGLHTGECELRASDIGGIAVHIAARVAALAGPDEILVSSTVKDLVTGSKIEFTPRGGAVLRDAGTWHVFAVASI
jgi:DNA-binding NarL/FixJ family response regulator